MADNVTDKQSMSELEKIINRLGDQINLSLSINGSLLQILMGLQPNQWEPPPTDSEDKKAPSGKIEAMNDLIEELKNNQNDAVEKIHALMNLI